MLFMVIEHFRGGDPRPVYERFRERGRLAPETVRYVGSWVDASLQRCYQVMEAADLENLREWTRHWEDLVDFDVHAVISSAEAARLVLGDEAQQGGT